MASTSWKEKLGRERWADASRGRRDTPLVMMVDASRGLVKDGGRLIRIKPPFVIYVSIYEQMLAQ